MKDKTATGDVLGPAFTSMLLFYPIAFSAFWAAPELVPLIVAIGMSQHWPIIGWGYGKPGLYGAHAVVRAIGAFVIWNWLPDGRFTWLPFWVAVVYLVTVAAIIIEARREAATYGLNAPPGTAEATGLSLPSAATEETPNVQSSTRMPRSTGLQVLPGLFGVGCSARRCR